MKQPDRTGPMQSNAKSSARYDIAVVGKALDVLEAFESHASLTLGELAHLTGQPKPSVFRVVTTLMNRGYLETSDEPDHYRLGLHLARAAWTVLARCTLRELARGPMRQLRDDFGHSVNLALRTRSEVIFIDVLPGLHIFRMDTVPGSPVELHATAAGKAIAAFLSEEELTHVLEVEGMPAFTGRTITTRADLRDELLRVRLRGYAIDDEEREPGARCIGAGILGADGTVQGAISLSAAAARLPDDTVPRIAAAVCAACERISTDLGCRPDALPGLTP